MPLLRHTRVICACPVSMGWKTTRLPLIVAPLMTMQIRSTWRLVVVSQAWRVCVVAVTNPTSMFRCPRRFHPRDASMRNGAAHGKYPETHQRNSPHRGVTQSYTCLVLVHATAIPVEKIPLLPILASWTAWLMHGSCTQDKDSLRRREPRIFVVTCLETT